MSDRNVVIEERREPRPAEPKCAECGVTQPLHHSSNRKACPRFKTEWPDRPRQTPWQAEGLSYLDWLERWR